MNSLVGLMTLIGPIAVSCCLPQQCVINLVAGLLISTWAQDHILNPISERTRVSITVLHVDVKFLLSGTTPHGLNSKR